MFVYSAKIIQRTGRLKLIYLIYMHLFHNASRIIKMVILVDLSAIAICHIFGISTHRRTGTFGLGGAVTFLPEKNCEMPERVGVEIGMQTQTFAIFPSNETATIGKKSAIESLQI